MSTEDGTMSERREGHLGSLFLATVLGVGIGLLAAPAPGATTRRVLGKRFASLREDLGDELEELGEASGRARRAVRARAENVRRRGKRAWDDAAEELEDLREQMRERMEEDEDEGSAVPTVLTVAAGLAAAAYLLTSERAAPARERVRERVREAATTVREEAQDRWQRFQDRRATRGQTEGPTRTDPAGSVPQPS
jgi:gas vesicle protein